MTLRYIFQTLGVAILIAVPKSSTGQAFDELLKAVTQGDSRTVATYLNQGLDPNTTDPVGNTILMTAARLGHHELVSLLIERKASVTRRSPFGDTALMVASLKGHLDIVKLLVDKGAEVSHGGWAPLHYAAFEGRAEVLRYLMEKRADKNALAPNGYSALMLAVRGGYLDAVQTLLYEDADVAVKGPKGETALGLATQFRHAAIAALLTRAGAVE